MERVRGVLSRSAEAFVRWPDGGTSAALVWVPAGTVCEVHQVHAVESGFGVLAHSTDAPELFVHVPVGWLEPLDELAAS